jgi:cytochrome c oxidase subunit 2
MTAALAGLALLVCAPAHAEWAVNMPRGVTPISRDVYDLHMLIFWICVIIGVVVFGAILWSVLRHRKSKGAVAAQWHESTTVELIWTIVPFIILVGMAIPAAGVLVNMEDSSDADLTVKITGYQWMWHYEYVDEGVEFYSRLDTPRRAILNEQPKEEDYILSVDNPLVLPVGAKIRFQHTSNDVIHSWWVPALSVKKDAIPGFINTNWARIDEPGTYRGKCAELCGRGHGFMPVVVEAVPPEEFRAWLERQRQAAAGERDDTVVAEQ